MRQPCAVCVPRLTHARLAHTCPWEAATQSSCTVRVYKQSLCQSHSLLTESTTKIIQMASPNKGIAWKHFDVHSKDKHGNRTSNCKFCDKLVVGSHSRHAAHYNPDDTAISETGPGMHRILSARFDGRGWLWMLTHLLVFRAASDLLRSGHKGPVPTLG